METLEEYFRREVAEGKIDFSLRVSVGPDKVYFYLHPLGKDGKTLDIKVRGDIIEILDLSACGLSDSDTKV